MILLVLKTLKNFILTYNLNNQIGGNNLVNKFSNTQAMTAPHIWNNGTTYQIEGGNMHLTNIRIFDTPIDEDQDKNVLNQYVVRDNQLSVIIDNAIPSIGFQKFKNAR